MQAHIENSLRDRQLSAVAAEPRIRFKEFGGAWNKVKLCEIATHITRKNTGLESNLPLTISAERGLVSQTTYFNNRVAAQNVAHYYLIMNGEFAYNRSSSDGSPYGAVKRLDSFEKGVLSTLYTVFALKQDSVDSDFLSVFFSTDLWHCDVRRRAAEGARNHGLLNISANDFLETEIMLPFSKAEQHQIATVFQNLDETIAATDARLEKLRQSKKSLLEKMFPRPGASVPEIRFKGFEGEWKTRKLGDKGKTISGVGFPEADQGGVFGTPFFKVSDMSNPGNESLMVRANNSVSEEQIRKHSWHPVENLPAILFAKVGAAALLNRKRLVKNRFLMDNNMMAYCLNDGCNADFFKFLFESIDLSSFVQVGALPSINGKDIESKAVRFPSLPEQQRIGAFFCEFDKLIESVQKKAAKLRQVKSALLEEMFV